MLWIIIPLLLCFDDSFSSWKCSVLWTFYLVTVLQVGNSWGSSENSFSLLIFLEWFVAYPCLSEVTSNSYRGSMNKNKGGECSADWEILRLILMSTLVTPLNAKREGILSCLFANSFRNFSLLYEVLGMSCEACSCWFCKVRKVASNVLKLSWNVCHLTVGEMYVRTNSSPRSLIILDFTVS